MSDAITLALLRHLVRSGEFGADDIVAIADDLVSQDEHRAAHLTRLSLIEALAQAPGEVEAERRRRDVRERTARLSNSDGGNLKA